MTTKDVKQFRVAILVFPFAAENLFVFAAKLAKVISEVSSKTVIVSGGIPDNIHFGTHVEVHDIGIRLHYVKDRSPKLYSIAVWLAKAMIVQIRFAQLVFRLRNDIDIFFFSMGCYYLLPIIAARLLRKKTLSASMGLYSVKARINYGHFIAWVVSVLSRLSFALSHRIVVESMRLAESKDLKGFREKICLGSLFLENLDQFSLFVPAYMRDKVIGFVGRLVPEKGIAEFVQTIPLVASAQPDARFMIIGTGIMDREIDEAIAHLPTAQKVTRIKWVEHGRINELLGQMRLLIVPSFEEGLPNIILEAMGVGTPVLASPVGGIPDLISDRITGFILNSTTPRGMAEKISSLLDDPILDQIATSARSLVERHYTIQASAARYQALLNELVENS